MKVEELLGRLRGVLPSAPWLGGVLQPAAWGPGASLRGALFLNSQTHDEGAVGCMMQGPLRFDQLCWQVSNLQLPVHSNSTRQILSCQACTPLHCLWQRLSDLYAPGDIRPTQAAMILGDG